MKKLYFLVSRFTLAAIIYGGLLSSSTSCVNSEYDMDKELDLEMNLLGTITLPVGSTSEITLGDMLDPDEIEELEKLENGDYTISMGDKIEVEIDDIVGEDGVSIAAISNDPETISTSFDSPDFPSFGLDIDDQTIDVAPGISSVEMGEGYNEAIEMDVAIELSSIPSYAGYKITNETLPLTITENPKSINLDFGGDISCPTEVSKVLNIDLEGSTVEFSFDVSAIADRFGDDFTITLPYAKITFPDGFLLNGTQSNAVELTNCDNSKDISKIKFSVTIDEYTEELANNSGSLEAITGLISCEIAERITISGTTAESTGASSDLELSVDTTIEVSDMTLLVDKIEVDVDTSDDEGSDSLGSAVTIDKLDKLIKSVTSITLNESANIVKFSISSIAIPNGLTASGDDILIKFPANKFNIDIMGDSDILYNDTDADNKTYDLHIPLTSIVGGSGFDKTIEIDQIILSDCPIQEDEDDDEYNYMVFDPAITMTSSKLILTGAQSGMTLSNFNDFVSAKAGSAYEVQEITIKVGDDKLEASTADIEIDDYIAEIDPSSNEINEEVEIPTEITRIDRMTFTDDVYINISIDVALAGTDADLSFHNYTIEFPKFLQFASDVDVDEDNVMVLNDTFEQTATGRSYTTKFQVVAIDFTDKQYDEIIEERGESQYLCLDEEVEMSGSIKIASGAVDSGAMGSDIDAVVTFSIDEMSISTVYGIVNPDIPLESQTIEIGDLSETIEGDLSAVLTNPTISLVASNSLAIPIEIESLTLQPSKGGENLDPLTIKSSILIDAADGSTPSVTEVLISGFEYDGGDPDVTYIEMEGLKELLNNLPDTIEISYSAAAIEIEGESHMIDLYPDTPYSFEIEYNIDIPLTFDSLTLDYTSTIEGIGADLGDVFEMISSLELELDIENTLPINLIIEKITPIDSDGNELTGLDSILAESSTIKANATSQLDVTIADNDAGDLSKMCDLEIQISATIDSTEGGSALNAEQYLKISILARIPDGITINLNDTEE